MTIEILRAPTEEDWERCKMLALNTVSKSFSGEVSGEWKRKILRTEHSPIRTLMFTIRMEVPYYVSVHFSRHKYGVEHYVTSQRNDRQSKYDRKKAPQDAPVVHIMDINAQELIFMARRRLCGMADPATRRVMEEIVNQVTGIMPEFDAVLVPMCEYTHSCNEFKGCGRWKQMDDVISVKLDKGAYIPERAHDLDAGYDIRTPKSFDVMTNGCATIDTGVHIAIPKGYVGMLKSKSGLNVKHNLTGEGTIDAGYNGSIVVKLYNHNGIMHRFYKGDKIIQLVLMPIFTPKLRVVDELPDTERGSNGFGSTGK